MDLEVGVARPPPAKEATSRSWVGSNNIKSRLSSFLLRRRRGHPEHEPSRESLDEVRASFRWTGQTGGELTDAYLSKGWTIHAI